MPEPFVYQIDTSDWDGAWKCDTQAEERTDHGRSPEELARAILEGWILDHPEKLTGGSRVAVFGDDPGAWPDDQVTNLRVQVFSGSSDDHDPEPAAVAYLVDEG